MVTIANVFFLLLSLFNPLSSECVTISQDNLSPLLSVLNDLNTDANSIAAVANVDANREGNGMANNSSGGNDNDIKSNAGIDAKTNVEHSAGNDGGKIFLKIFTFLLLFLLGMEIIILNDRLLLYTIGRFIKIRKLRVIAVSFFLRMLTIAGILYVTFSQGSGYGLAIAMGMIMGKILSRIGGKIIRISRI